VVFTSIQISFQALSMSLVPALLLVMNWGGYAYAVKSGYVVQASYAYLILPVLFLSLNLILGKEQKLSTKICVFFAVVIIGIDCFINQILPTIGLLISVPFVGYIFWHNKYNLDPVKSIFQETFLMLPITFFLLIEHDAILFRLSSQEVLYLSVLGLLTVLPLSLFVNSTKKVSFNVLPIYQSISPVIGISLGIFLYKEPININSIISYGCLLALLITYNLYNSRRKTNG
jgi:chloramphenicol-sensitive protein RarD